MSEELLLTVYERAWNARDPDACAGCFTRDGVREARLRRGAPAGVRGRGAIRADIALVMAAVPDLAVEVLAAAYASDRRLWTEWRVTGACAGEAARPLDLVGVSVFRLSNDGFREERLYWDSAFLR
jgi:hypothetical protein